MGGGNSTVEREPINLRWMDIKVIDVPKNKRLYKFACWFLGKKEEKMSYKELYIFFYGLNKGRLGEYEAKKKALNKILEIYKYLNKNKLPKGFEDE